MQLKGPITKRLMDVTGCRIESNPREDDSIEFSVSLQSISDTIGNLGTVDSNSAYAPLSMTTTVPTSMKDKQISFLVTSKDNHGQLRSRGGDTVEIKIESPSGDLPYIINDNKNGTYSVNFVTSVEGQNKVNVLLRGLHVQNSPWNVFVSTSVDYTKLGKATKKVGTQGKSNGQFNAPRAIAITSQGKYVIVDSDNHRIQFFDQNFKYIGQFGSKGANDGQFLNPSDVALTAKDQIIIADKGNNRIQLFEPNGKFILKFGVAGNGNGQFLDPVSVAINVPADTIFIADQNNHRIQAFNTKGQFLYNFGSRGTGDGQFKNPTGVAVNKTTGDIVVCDRLNNRVQLFDAEGKFIRKFGSDGKNN
jgi:DNA-binding beta-propeller fold protein YncE